MSQIVSKEQCGVNSGMALTSSESVELRFAGPEDLVGIGDFLEEWGGPRFGENRFPGKTAREFYDWKYFGNPLAKSVVAVAMAGDRVVSTLAAMPKPLQIRDRRLIAYELGDLLTASDFRKRGLGSKIAQMVCAEAAARGAALIYGQPNDNSFPVLTKLGFLELQQIHQRSYPVPSRLISRRLHLPAETISWTHIDNLMSRLAAPPRSEVRVERISRFDAETDIIWQKAGKEYSFLLARESDFLNWRYADSPTQFQMWLARHDGTPVGFLVGFASANEGLAEIVDLFVSPHERAAAQALLHHAFQEFHEQQMRAILAYTIAHQPLSMVGELLRRACPVARDRPLHFIVRCVDPIVADQLPMSKWHLSPGDFDGV